MPYLQDLGFVHESRDPLYQLFLEKMYQVKKLPLDTVLSKDELAQQEKLAEEIVTELVKRGKADELSTLARELKLQLEENP
jgi:antitoxin component of RelBE/YafQ-DinJ toxin-antitoxin module